MYYLLSRFRKRYHALLHNYYYYYYYLMKRLLERSIYIIAGTLVLLHPFPYHTSRTTQKDTYTHTSYYYISKNRCRIKNEERTELSRCIIFIGYETLVSPVASWKLELPPLGQSGYDSRRQFYTQFWMPIKYF